MQAIILLKPGELLQPFHQHGWCELASTYLSYTPKEFIYTPIPTCKITIVDISQLILREHGVSVMMLFVAFWEHCLIICKSRERLTIGSRDSGVLLACACHGDSMHTSRAIAVSILSTVWYFPYNGSADFPSSNCHASSLKKYPLSCRFIQLIPAFEAIALSYICFNFIQNQLIHSMHHPRNTNEPHASRSPSFICFPSLSVYHSSVRHATRCQCSASSRV